MNGKLGGLRRPPPPPPPARPTADIDVKAEARMQENTDLRLLLNSLRIDQEQRTIRRPPPPPPPQAGRGRGQVVKSEDVDSSIGISRPKPPKPLRLPFEKNKNENVFQDADEGKTGQTKTCLVQPQKAPEKLPNETVEKVVEDFNNNNHSGKVPNGFSGERKTNEAVTGTLDLNLAQKTSIATPEMFNLNNYVKLMPHGENKYVATSLVYEIKNIDRPIGIIVLNNTKTIVISEQGKNQVKMYNPDGSTKKVIEPKRPFKKPTDMVALKDGFAVRDSLGIQVFDGQGKFIKSLCEDALGYVFGLTTNDVGNVITINSNSGSYVKEGNPTAKGATDIIEIDVAENIIVRQIELTDIIQDKARSKCRFLHCNRNRLFIVDLGLNCVYVLSLKDSISVRKFGTAGKSDGQFRDPAGLVSDSFGNFILADAGNHRLQLFDKSRKFVGLVHIKQGLKRPSGIYLDQEEEALYVLNLNGNSMAKYALTRNKISS